MIRRYKSANILIENYINENDFIQYHKDKKKNNIKIEIVNFNIKVLGI